MFTSLRVLIMISCSNNDILDTDVATTEHSLVTSHCALVIFIPVNINISLQDHYVHFPNFLTSETTSKPLDRTHAHTWPDNGAYPYHRQTKWNKTPLSFISSFWISQELIYKKEKKSSSLSRSRNFSNIICHSWIIIIREMLCIFPRNVLRYINMENKC